jgi:MFS superfamily sulfate permease-like transporter
MDNSKLPAAPAGWLNAFRHDFLASVVVFLVALPLCMGIAIASGVPPEKAAAVGVLTGVIGGLVVGSIGGSPLQVSGPAAGLSVIVFELTQQYGWEKVGVVIALAGAFQLAAGVFKLGQWFRAVSPAVVHGMLAGIGVLIFASQFHIMVDDQPRGSGLANLLSIPEAVWKGVVPDGDVSHDDAARVGLLTICLMVVWKPFVPKKLKVIPAPLVAVTVATAATVLVQLPIKRVAVPDNLLDAVQLPVWDGLRGYEDWKPLVLAGLAMAVIASAETLLCATAVDQMHQGPRAKYDRELAAQGVGNLLSGLLGALPITGVIVRSAANVEAGGRTRASAILHGCWLLIFVCLFPFVLRWVPTAALAAILVYTGYKLVNPKAVKTLWAYGKGELLIYAATVVAIVATDLLTGVLVGVGLATAKLLHTITSLTIRLREEEDGRRTVLSLRGAATFLRLPKLAAALERVRPDTELHVHFEDLSYIDHACLDLLMNWEKQHEATGGDLVLDWESLTARFHSYGRPRHGHRAGPHPDSETPERDGHVEAPQPAPGPNSR